MLIILFLYKNIFNENHYLLKALSKISNYDIVLLIVLLNDHGKQILKFQNKINLCYQISYDL